MSANKNKDNKGGRQSNLLSFFQKTPKREQQQSTNQSADAEQIGERENLPRTTPKRSPKKSANQPTTPLASIKRTDRHQNEVKSAENFEAATPAPVILDSDDDENSRGVGFLSCASSSSNPPAKRRRVILSSDEEEDEKEDRFKREEEAGDGTPARKKTIAAKRRVEDEEENKGDEEDVKMEVENQSFDGKPPELEVKKTNKQPKKLARKSEAISDFTHSFIDSFSFDSTTNTLDTSTTIQEQGKKQNPGKTKKTEEDAPASEHFPHLDYAHLKPEKIKDANGKRPTDPDYNPKTLFLPEKFMDEQTPGHKQWWIFKAQNFDTVIFFKVGKFYELYHMDAVVAVENLGLTYMRGKYAHAGFPEVAYGRFADQLINRGYKVGRVEQTETPSQLAERQKQKASAQKEKVVRREICRVTTLGTKTYGILDGTDTREADGTMEPNASYLMAITERPEQLGSPTRFGICFVDCSVGQFQLSEFDDDRGQSNLRTLLAHNFPAQVLYEKGTISPNTMALLNTTLASVPKEALYPKRQFLTAEKTVSTLFSEANYLGPTLAEWPKALLGMLAEQGATTVPQPGIDRQLCLSALGAILWYLKECLIDVDLVSMKKFKEYSPPSIEDGKAKMERDSGTFWKDKCMVLDGVSLLNLHILPALSLSSFANANSRARNDPIATFSLLNTINRCQTAFGKRLLRQWISAPSCDRQVLLERQGAIGWLVGEGMRPNVVKWAELLRKVPDLERLFQRIHTIGLKYRADPLHGHPDSRAQMFEADKYNRRKIKDLLMVLDGLEQVQRLMRMFCRVNEQAEEKAPQLLMDCLGASVEGMDEDLKFFKEAFDRESALQNGVILPHKGVDREFDKSCRGMDECARQLDTFLDGVKKRLKCTNIKFIGTGRNQHQMEVPESACRHVPDDFQLTSQRKGFKRYTTGELQRLVGLLAEAEARRDEISAEVTRRVFADFDARKDKWSSVVQRIGQFDCLLALTFYAQTSSLQMCFPEFVFDADEPFLSIKRGFYPSLVDSKCGKTAGTGTADEFNYIPNSCHLGREPGHGQGRARTLLLTGPNMGGKSTYMRQVASLVVLAQIGSMVPADSMRLTPVDRVFCRIGASDRLAMGQSTFYVELDETNKIIRQATPHSLCIVDELGRGTSTHDGTAIAAAVLKHISGKIRCRTLFSTHYHALCKFIAGSEDVQFGHMACVVENECVEDPTLERITFLYSLAEGICDKSYGFHTAKMAGIDVETVRKAFDASKMLMEPTQEEEEEENKLAGLRKAAMDEASTDAELHGMIRDLAPSSC